MKEKFKKKEEKKDKIKEKRDEKLYGNKKEEKALDENEGFDLGVIFNNIIEYQNIKNHEFVKEPRNLKFKQDIAINANNHTASNDLFEIFVSYKDNDEYLVFQNSINYNLDIYSMLNQQKIRSIEGLKNNIRTLRYFMNDNNKNEYLIGIDDKNGIILDISNNFNILNSLDFKNNYNISSCLLIFPKNVDEIYIITSYGFKAYGGSNIYILSNKNEIKYIDKINNNIPILYLLSWYNKNDNENYIIQFSYKEIIINNLLSKKIYVELSHNGAFNYSSGFIYSKDKKDYLCASSMSGKVIIWDLLTKNQFITFGLNEFKISQILCWNLKLYIAPTYDNNKIIIIDIEKRQIYFPNNNEITKKLICLKKIYHKIYGESLVGAYRDGTIKIWTIE